VSQDSGAPGAPSASHAVCPDELGQPIYPTKLTRAFKLHRKAAGVTTESLHILRHTHATLALTNGVPLHVLAARIGDRAETCSRNAHLLPTSDAETAEQVAALVPVSTPFAKEAQTCMVASVS
jgi:integrase